jgi:hypothetical protein
MCTKTEINKATERVKKSNRESAQQFKQDQRDYERKMKKII